MLLSLLLKKVDSTWSKFIFRTQSFFQKLPAFYLLSGYMFYNSATVSVAFPSPLIWWFLLPPYLLEVAAVLPRGFGHTIAAGMTAAITSAEAARESKGGLRAVVRENFRPVVSSCGKRQQSNSLLHQGISVNLLHFPAHDKISLANLFSSVSVLQPTHHLRGEGKWEAGKQTHSTHLVWVVLGVSAEGAVTVLWAAFSVERDVKEREKGNRAVLRDGMQCGVRRSFVNEAFVLGAWEEHLRLSPPRQLEWKFPIYLVAGLIFISLCAVSVDGQPQSRTKISHASHTLPKLIWQFHIGDYA